MPKHTLIITAIATATIALGAIATYIIQEQGGEEVRQEQPVATLPEAPEEIPEESPTTQPIDISNWKIYHNDEFGFEFRYPEPFQIIPQQGLGVHLDYIKANPIHTVTVGPAQRSSPLVVMYVFKNTDQLPVASWLREVGDKDNEVFNYISEATTKPRGLTGYKVLFITRRVWPYVSHTWFVANRNMAYILIFVEEDEGFEKLDDDKRILSQLAEVVNSFRLK